MGPRRWRLGRTLRLHLLRQIVLPSLFALVGFTLVQLTTDLLAYTDLVVNRGFGLAEVGRIASLQILPSMVRMLPFALLVGSLMGLGGLGANREILVLEASGISARQLIGPVLLIAAIVGVGSLGFTLEGEARARRALDSALLEMARRNPSTVIHPGSPSWFGDWRLMAREVSRSGDRLTGVMLWSPEFEDTIFAQEAHLEPAEQGEIHLTLDHGLVLSDSDRHPGLLRFGRTDEHLPRSDGSEEVPVDEWAVAPLAELARVAVSDPDGLRRRRAGAEWHRRFAQPASTLIFGLLAVPLFLRRGHFSRSGGAALGVGVAVAYYSLVQLGDGLIRIPAIPVAAAVWLPNVVALAVALVMVARLDRLSGNARERSRGGGTWRSWLPRRREVGGGHFVLDRYVLGQFLEMALLCTAALLVAYLLIDVLNNVRWFAKYDSTIAEVVRFYGARLPVLASRVIPLGLLVGAALTVSLLAANGELIAFRACGVSTLRVEVPMLALCAVLAALYYPFTNELVPRTNALASHLKLTEIKDRPLARTKVWRRAGDRFFEAERLDPLQGVATSLTLYELGADGLPWSRTDAVAARHVGEGLWRLVEPTRVELESGRLRRAESESFVLLGQDVNAEVETEHLTPSELRQEIRDLEHHGYDALGFRVDLQVKLARPLLCLILPALALLYAALGPPFPSPVKTLVASFVVALIQILVVSIGASLGYGGVLPPVVAGWGPLAILGAAAGGFALRVKNVGQGL